MTDDWKSIHIRIPTELYNHIKSEGINISSYLTSILDQKYKIGALGKPSVTCNGSASTKPITTMELIRKNVDELGINLDDVRAKGGFDAITVSEFYNRIHRITPISRETLYKMMMSIL